MCYRGPTEQRLKSSNMPLRCGSKIELWNKMIKEVSLKKIPHPFKSIPFEYYIQSPAGLVPKAQDTTTKQNTDTGIITPQTRLVFNLSWPKGQSINNFTPKELCSLKYKDLDSAVQLCLEIINRPDNQNGKC